MNKKRNLLFTFLATLAITGCGGSIQNDRSTLQEPTIPQATKVTRANWDGVEPIADNFFITDDGTLLSFKIADDAIANGNVRAVDVFIDADNNPNTGYVNGAGLWGHIGAEYLVENNNLYSYAGNGWHWNFVARISRTPMNGNEIELEFPRNLIHTTNTIRAIAGLQDNNWNNIRRTQVVSYTLQPEVVDNRPNRYSVDDNENDFLFRIQSPRVADGVVQTQDIFIDIDNNPNTGYSNPRWGDIGAEYLIEGGSLYSYGGQGWSWNFIANIQRDMHDDTITVTAPKNLFTLTSAQIRTVAGLSNQNWELVDRYDIAPYTIQNGLNGDAQADGTLNLTDSPNSITIAISNQNIADGNVQTQDIFIDSDNNPNTGYSNPRWNLGQMGADYLIEGNTIYAHNGGGWSWSRVGVVNRAVADDTITVTLDKHIVNLTPTIRVMATLNDHNWQPFVRFGAQSLSVALPATGNTIIRHDLSFFWFRIHSDNINFNDNMHTEFYIDADDNPNTGVRFNGIGAEYRIVDNQAFALRGNGEWGALFNGEASAVPLNITAHDIEVRTRRSQLLYTHRHIAVSGRVTDANGNELLVSNPTHYEVRADDDEITFSLEDPQFYIFRFHSPLIQMDHYSPNRAVDDFVHTLHFAIDADNNRFTGNQMNAVGADYWTRSDVRYQHTYHFIGIPHDGQRHSWIDRWEVIDGGETTVFAQDGLVEIRMPRSAMNLSHHFTVASTFNDRHGHFYWTNRYEFEIPNN